MVLKPRKVDDLVTIGQRPKNYSESAMASTKTLDMRCHTTKTILKRPVRGLYCTHAEAVSLDHLAGVMETAIGIAWECAICSKPNYKLQIDKRFEKIVEDSRKRAFKPTHCYFTREGTSRFIKPKDHLGGKNDTDEESCMEGEEENAESDSNPEAEREDQPPQQQPAKRPSRAAPLQREIATRNSYHKPDRQRLQKSFTSRRKMSESGDAEVIEEPEHSDEGEEEQNGSASSEQKSYGSGEISDSEGSNSPVAKKTKNGRIQGLNSNQDDIRKTLRRRSSPQKLQTQPPRGKGGYWYHQKRQEEAKARQATLDG